MAGCTFTSQKSRWCVILPASLNDSRVIIGSLRWKGEGGQKERPEGWKCSAREWAESDSNDTVESESAAGSGLDGLDAAEWRPGKMRICRVCSTIVRLWPSAREEIH